MNIGSQSATPSNYESVANNLRKRGFLYWKQSLKPLKESQFKAAWDEFAEACVGENKRTNHDDAWKILEKVFTETYGSEDHFDKALFGTIDTSKSDCVIHLQT